MTPATCRIPFNKPRLFPEAERYVLDAIRSGRHCGNHGWGAKCVEFLQRRFGFRSAFLVPSGTAALEMGCVLAGLGPGDEVVMPSYTFSSTANAVCLQGAKPVFCEVDPATMNIDASGIERLITPRTKMILPIDYAGIPCDLGRIMPLAEKYGLTVFVDAAQSMNSRDASGRWAGSATPLAAFSCHETKNFACGEGGVLAVNDPDRHLQACFIQEKGTDRRLVLDGVRNKYGWVCKGSSYLLSDILAAMLYAQFEHMDETTGLRARVTEAYRALFAPYEAGGCLSTPHPDGAIRLNHHAFFVVFDTAAHRQLFLGRLRERGVFAYIGYLPLHSSDMGRRLGYKAGDLPLTENLASRIVRLPFYADLALDGLDYAVESMKTVLDGIYGG